MSFGPIDYGRLGETIRRELGRPYFWFEMLAPDVVTAGPESFDVGDADEPHVVRFGNRYLMYYACYDGTYWGVCLAEAASLEGPWVKRGRVLGGPPNLKPEAIVVRDGTIYFYAMQWGPSPAIYSGRLYTSRDGVNFVDEGTVLLPDDYDVGDDGAAYPVAVWYDKDLGRWFMFYMAWRKVYDPLNTGRNLYLAESSDGVGWRKLGLAVGCSVHGLRVLEGDVVRIGDTYFYLNPRFHVQSAWYISFRRPHVFTFHKLPSFEVLTDPETYEYYGSHYDDFYPFYENGLLYLFAGEAKSPSNIHLFVSSVPDFHQPVEPYELLPRSFSLPALRGYAIAANETKTVACILPTLHYRRVTVHVSDTEAATVNLYADFDGRGSWKLLDSRSFSSGFSYTWLVEIKAVHIVVEVKQGGASGTLDIYFGGDRGE